MHNDNTGINIDEHVMCTVQGTAARSGDPAIDVAKARALGNALVPFLVVPWTCSLIVYSGAFSSGHDNPGSLLVSVFVTHPKQKQKP